jgi:nicotinamide-nucleotide amidase
MQASILAIGDELTLGQCVDTNSAWLAEQLLARSVETREHRTVGDDRAAIAAAIRELAGASDLLLITGGLGPTEDDVTREGLADVLTPGRELVTDEAAVAEIRRWFDGRGSRMPERNLVQALRPETARCLPNPRGTAPGLAAERDGCLIFALPGPPREMQPMFREHVIAALKTAQSDDHVILTAKVNAYGVGESSAAEKIITMTARDRNPLVGTTASEGIISARIRATGTAAEAQRLIDETIERVERAWKPFAFSRSDTALPEAVGRLLRDAGRTVVTAESCTGGWLGKLIVDIPGSSDYYLGGWVTYTNAMKTACLGVEPRLFGEFGAVSEQVAAAMAESALAAGGSDHALSITGIAGPEPSEGGKPAGLVYIGLASRRGDSVETCVRRFRFPGERGTVRDRSCKSALQMLRFELIGEGQRRPMLWEARDVTRSGGKAAGVADGL